MAIPFKVNPDPPKRSAEADPFLEFDSERPGVRGTTVLQEPLLRPEPVQTLRERFDLPVTEPTLGLGQPLRKSAISPALAFGIGVAGIVTAAVAYYQLSQVLSTRTSASQAESDTTTPGASPAATAPASRVAEKPPAPVIPAGTGRIDVASNPPGALVSFNGVARGVTPYILTGLPAGRHTIVISRGSFHATRTVEIGPGGATAVSVAIPYSVVRSSPLPRVPGQPLTAAGAGDSAGAASGWLTFDLPVDLAVYQDGRLRGSTREGRVALTAGTHNIVLANPDYEYREVVSVTVGADRTTPANIPLPTGSLSLNALPWADVWVDGTSVGTTPLANLSLPIGSHEVLWRHPTLGERRQLVVVKAKTPARAGVDFTR